MNRKLSNIAIAASVLGGTALGATLVGTAGAYGGNADPADTNTQVETLDASGNFVPVQDDTPADPPPEGDPGREGHGRHSGGCNLEEIAAVIGIETDDLRAQLDAGNSIADVAAANNIDIDLVVDAVLADKEARLDAQVDAGDLTETEADERLADAEDRALDRLSGTRGEAPADA